MFIVILNKLNVGKYITFYIRIEEKKMKSSE